MTLIREKQFRTETLGLPLRRVLATQKGQGIAGTDCDRQPEPLYP